MLNAVNLDKHEYQYYHYSYKRDGYYSADPTHPRTTMGRREPPPRHIENGPACEMTVDSIRQIWLSAGRVTYRK